MSYIKNLIAVATSDGSLDNNESTLIVKIALKRGLKRWQINELLKDSNGDEVYIPETSSSRMNMLYDLMQLIYADGRVSASEYHFIVKFLQALQLPGDMLLPLFALFQVRAPDQEEWNKFIGITHEE